MGQTLSELVRANLRKLILHRFPEGGIQARATALGVGKGTVERIQKTEAHPFDLSVIQQIAEKCQTAPWKLFVEDFDPVAPPLLAKEAVQQRARFEAMRLLVVETPDQKSLPKGKREAQDDVTSTHNLIKSLKAESNVGVSVSSSGKKPGRSGKLARTTRTSRTKRD